MPERIVIACDLIAAAIVANGGKILSVINHRDEHNQPTRVIQASLADMREFSVIIGL